MENLSRQPVFNTVQTFTERLAQLLAAALMAAMAAVAAAEDTADPAGLSPYKAQYKLSKSGLTLEVTRELKSSADGVFTLSQGGRNMVANIHEMSAFEVEGMRILPKSFVYQLRAPFVNRRREVHFTPGAETIRSLYKDQWYDLPYTPETLDRFSVQEQLRLFLLNDPTPKEDFSVPVADGKRVKTYDFVFVAEETVQTPLGPLRSLHFRRLHDDPERKSDTWISPELNYLIVKATHTEDGSPTELVITSTSMQGAEAQSQQ